MGPKPISVLKRFWRRVEKTNGCWLWTGYKKKGYGTFMVKAGRCVRASRFSWELVNGLIPSGLYVCHKCDTPACVRPDHLFLGTQADNLTDMKRKNRQARGARLPHTKLSDTEVAAVRRSTLPGTEVAKCLGVSTALISMIRNNKLRNTA